MRKKMLLVLVVSLLLTLFAGQSHAVTLSGAIGTGGQFYDADNGQYYLIFDALSVNGTPYWLIWQFNQNTAGWDIINGSTISQTGTGYSYGAYVYDNTSQILVVKSNVASPAILGSSCSKGLVLGKHVFAVTNLTATSVSVRNVESTTASTLTFTRSSGTPGNITGIWTNVDSSGNTTAIALNTDGSDVVYENIVSCSSK
ncbi:MAG: hypothetical protein HQK95_04205 [Nitrospirae bacterium]|nr:hypothetical protein [Nitrospirota bacterium]